MTLTLSLSSWYYVMYVMIDANGTHQQASSKYSIVLTCHTKPPPSITMKRIKPFKEKQRAAIKYSLP